MSPQLEGGKIAGDFCPNCGQHLEKRPSRKAKCPHCGKFIVVRKPFLMTEKEAQLTDEAARLEGFGITREAIDKQRVRLAKKFGFDPSVGDILWGTLNAHLMDHKSNPIMERMDSSTVLRFTYFEMGRRLRREGKDPSRSYAQAAKWELFQFLDSPLVTNVKVVNDNDNQVCPKCRALLGREFPIKVAYETLPAHSVCENKERGCSCHYEPIFDI